MRSKTYDQMRQRLVNAAKERKVPLLGHFELTSRCNLDCKMCYVHTQNSVEVLNRELTTDQWKQIFNEAYDCGMLYAFLTGGECLFRKDFKEIYLHLWNKKIRVSMQTNGTLLNDEYVEFFKTYPPDGVRISLYGSCEEGYVNVTGHKGFEKTIRAINALTEIGIDVRVGVTPSRYMRDDYINILKLCKEKGFDLIQNDLLLLPNRDMPEKDDYFLCEEEILSLSKQRAELNRKLVPAENTPEPVGDMNEAPPKGLTCNAGNCLAALSWDGKMHPCLNAMIGGADVLKLGYAEAWRQTVAVAANVEHAIECVGCAYDKICPKCPAHRLKDFYSGHCAPGLCEMTRKLVAAGVKKLEREEKCD